MFRIILMLLFISLLSCSEDNNTIDTESEVEKFYGRWVLQKYTKYYPDGTIDIEDPPNRAVTFFFNDDGSIEIYTGSQFTSAQWEIQANSKLRIYTNQDEEIFDYQMSASDLILTIIREQNVKFVYEYNKQ